MSWLILGFQFEFPLGTTDGAFSLGVHKLGGVCHKEDITIFGWAAPFECGFNNNFHKKSVTKTGTYGNGKLHPTV